MTDRHLISNTELKGFSIIPSKRSGGKTSAAQYTLYRGVADGGGGGGRGGQDPRTFENRGGRLPINLVIFSNFFNETLKNAFSNIFLTKWPKFEEKLIFWGRWVWVPMNPPPPPRSQSKLRGDALAFIGNITC